MSSMRACSFWLANDGKWYLTLGNHEYAFEREDCTDYGPFDSEEEADRYLRNNFTNPGCSDTWDEGTADPPENPVRPRSRWT